MGRVPDDSIDAAPVEPAGGSTGDTSVHSISESTYPGDTDAADPEDHRDSHRIDWRLGGQSVALWRARTLSIAMSAMVAGILGSAALTMFVSAAWVPVAASVLMWAGMFTGILWALTRSRPTGLLRFSSTDIIFGVALGIALRMCQGWLELAGGGSGALPAYPAAGGRLPTGFVFTELVGVVVIAPVLEEHFFRGVVLVCLYTILRRAAGKVTAGIAAGIGSAGLFVLVRALTMPYTIDQLVALGLLGIVCSALLLLTGRIWGAVLTHAVYSGSFVLLALAGTYLT